MQPYSYHLPAERIAQRPIHPPHLAKLLVIDRGTQKLEISTFERIGDFLSPATLLIFNDSRVVPARLFGSIGDRLSVEMLLLTQLTDDPDAAASTWKVAARPLRKIKLGDIIQFPHGLTATMEGRAGRYGVVRFNLDRKQLSDYLWAHGNMPIPPYIREGHSDEQDKTDYQSALARVDGSIAAPTASLHFSPELISSLQERRISMDTITLHVGAASIEAVWDGVTMQKPGSEEYVVSKALFERMQAASHVTCVGTTVVRAVESVTQPGVPTQTELFINPGYTFKHVDSLVTNFHQPGTTHLLLVEAFLGRQLLEKAYSTALAEGFRFLSYGDGMLIL